MPDTATLSLLTAARQDGAPTPDFVKAIRAAGRERWEQHGFPGDRDEQWRYTNLRYLRNTDWQPSAGADREAAQAVVRKFTFGVGALVEAVIVNGKYDAAFSMNVGELPDGAAVLPLADAAGAPAYADLVRGALAKRALVDKNVFAALNTAALGDGVFVHLPTGTKLDQPIHVLIVGVPEAKPSASYPRVLVVAGDDVHATVVESYVGPEKGRYFTCAVTEISAGADSVVDHYKLQQDSLDACHVAVTETIVGARSKFISHNCTIGGRLTRNDYNVVLDGREATSTLNGLVLIGGSQHVDNHTLLEHVHPDCPSHELYKHVIDGRASAVFKGKIHVHQAAQRTDAKQSSKTLLLSDEAQQHSMPALEIYADDVKCTHGSTVGPVDEEAVFYLNTRGVSRDQAKRLLTYAFLADVTRRIQVAPVRERLEAFMAAQHGLPQDLRIQELGAHDSDVVY